MNLEDESTMPAFDMPLEQLKQYAGTNPRPADFESYWDDALAEMRAADGRVELKPAEFQTPAAECFDLYFTGVRGARIHAKYLRPKNGGRPHPAILQFHGYSGNSGDWSEYLKYVLLGFSVASLDCRGQGGLSEDAGGVRGNTLKGHIIRGLDDDKENLLFRHIFLDTAQLAHIVMEMPEVDRQRIGVIGGSQGGGLTLACAALVPEVKRACAQFPFLSDYKRVWELDLAKDAYEELRDYFRRFDPRHEREEEIYTKLGYIDVQNLAGRIQAEVLFGTGLMDTVCPPSTQFAAYNKIRSPKQMLIYPDYAHEGLPGFMDKAFGFMSAL
jgi:cephalosporin-C deacetylase